MPTIALYEFIGPNTDNSPRFKANAIKQLQIAPIIPPKIAYCQNPCPNVVFLHKIKRGNEKIESNK